MSIKFILLISGLASLTGRSSSSKLGVQEYITNAGQYYISKERSDLPLAVFQCYVDSMMPVSVSDLEGNSQLWEELNDTQSDDKPEEFWVADRDVDWRELFQLYWIYNGIYLDYGASPLRCFKFSLKASRGFNVSEPSNCLENNHRFVCKKARNAISRSLIGKVKSTIGSVVSKTQQVGRWFKEKLKKIGDFTAGELTEIGEIVIDTFKQTGSNIGSGVKGVTLWTKENMEALATKIAEDLHWSKDKAKDALNKVLEVIDEETDELLKD